MSEPINDGGPAFPLATIDGYAVDGMTMRDYFAAKAMHSMDTSRNSNPNTIFPECVNAYRWADAMIKARGL